MKKKNGDIVGMRVFLVHNIALLFCWCFILHVYQLGSDKVGLCTAL